MLVFACPGQGSQTSGFLSPWLEHSPNLESRLRKLSEACGKDLVWLGTEADEETIRQTDNAQPLIVGSAIAIYRELFDGQAEGVLGHSVGEFAAAAIAGVISDEDAIRLVSLRAGAMAKAAKLKQTTMSAVLGGDADQVLQAIEAAGLYAANHNGAGQIVAAGLRKDIESFAQNPPERARVIELKVAGAFHTPHMSSAVAELAEAASNIEVQDPTIALWTNFNGERVLSGKEFLNHMVEQTAREVRWDKCMVHLQNEAAKVVELPPAGALSGLIKRGCEGVGALALKSPVDLAKVSEL